MLLPETPAATGSGGQVRIYHFVKAASQVADVTVAVLAEPDSGSVPAELNVQRVIRPQVSSTPITQHGGPLGALMILFGGFGSYGRALMLAGHNICVERSGGKHQSVFHRAYGWLLLTLASLLARVTWLFPNDIHVRGQCWDLIQDDLERMNASPDYIWFEHSYLFPLSNILGQRFPKSQFIVNSHNVEWVLKDSIAKTKTSSLARRWMQLESRIIRLWETRMVAESALIYTCSEDDKQRLENSDAVSASRIVAIPNGVDVNYFVPRNEQTETPTLLFAGTSGYPPNDDAVVWLTSEIFPSIRREVPSCQLILAGRNAKQNWKHLQSQERGITVLSDVPDMRPVLGSAWVSVVPLRSGSGTRLKIVEAMSAGRCVVSTTIGAEGLNLSPGADLIIYDDPTDFAKAVCDVIEDEQQRKAFEIRGREVACERFSWRQLSLQAANEFQRQIESEELVSAN